MKQKLVILSTAMLFLAACNNEGASTEASDDNAPKSSDSAELTTTANEPYADTGQHRSATTEQLKPVDSASAQFLRKAADGGMAEVNAGKMAQEKATDESVKRFAQMMVQDHSDANSQIRTLSSARQVMLPTAPSEEHQKMAAQMDQKGGKSFNTAYMTMMVADHKKTISLFEKGLKDSKDEQVKGFISTTIPKLKMHLDSAVAIQRRLK